MPYIKVGQENSGPVDLYTKTTARDGRSSLIHGYPLSGRAWDRQVQVQLLNGHWVISYDRRRFGKSSQLATGCDCDTFAGDRHTLLETLDLREVTLAGYSMETGEVTRYLGRYGSARVARGAGVPISVRRDGRLVQMDRGGHPTINPFINPGGAKNEYDTGHPAGDVANYLLLWSKILQASGGYSADEATAAASIVLPGILRYNRAQRASYPNGPILTDNADLLAEFPFLGPPSL